jgi:hypothetical protein
LLAKLRASPATLSKARGFRLQRPCIGLSGSIDRTARNYSALQSRSWVNGVVSAMSTLSPRGNGASAGMPDFLQPVSGRSAPSRSASGHLRLRRLKPHHGVCPLRPESGRVGRHLPKSALCHNRTRAPQQTPGYSITSLAAETKSGGSATPSAWAARRLTMKSNCDEALMGRSAGLAPRRMRST